MSQEELKNNYFKAVGDNLSDITSLKLAYEIVEQVINNVIYNVESNTDKKNFNTLSTISLQLKEILENNNY